MSEGRPLITVDGAIWVLGLTAAAYGLAFTYEQGYADQLRLPLSLMDVSFLSLYRSLVWVGGIAALVFALELMVVKAILQPMLKVEKFPLVPKSLVAGVILFVLVAAMLNVSLAWGTAGILIVGLAACLIAPIFTDRKKKYRSYAERLAAADAYFRAGTDVAPRFAFVLATLTIALLAFHVASAAGQWEARGQKEFLVAETSPPCVIINAHGDTLVCAEVAGNQLLGQFLFLSKEDGLKLKLQKVGPLKPVPVPER